MSFSSSLLLEYLPLEGLARQPPAFWQEVLGVVGFAAPPPLTPASVPVTASMTPLLGSEQDLCEVWRVDGTMAGHAVAGAAAHGRVRYRQMGDWLFGCVRIDESALTAGASAAALRRATELAYADIFAVLDHTGYPHLVRVWNYLADINADSDGDERYRHFNSARQAAFAQLRLADRRSVPAASALGSRSGAPLSIHFLASRAAPLAIENPRQVSAYDYPRQYGEHSPLFSRACVLDADGGSHLFVSGTASIVGHETIHRGDVAAQTRETMTNIAALLDEAARRSGTPVCQLADLKYKVYVRHRRDLPAIAAELSTWLGPSAAIVFLQADVCREDLLVEIEASGATGRA
jgi:enamine deaminase RidA (YjgF/YER057c/UK114 family)